MEKVKEYLDQLVQLNMLEKVTNSNYRFRNKMLLDIVYSRLLFKQKREIHHKIALFYEGKYKNLGIDFGSLDPNQEKIDTEEDKEINMNYRKNERIQSVSNQKGIFFILSRHWLGAILDEKEGLFFFTIF